MAADPHSEHTCFDFRSTCSGVGVLQGSQNPTWPNEMADAKKYPTINIYEEVSRFCMKIMVFWVCWRVVRFAVFCLKSLFRTYGLPLLKGGNK